MIAINKSEFQEAKGKNNDPYGAGVYAYAERWADLMEEGMLAGKQLVEIAEESSHIADTNGITVFMYGSAVVVLSIFWEHGDALRRWHNKETQIGDEGDKANEFGAWVGIKCALHRQAKELADLRKDKTRLDAIIANHWQVRLVWDKWCVLQPAQQYFASADTPREAIDKAMEATE